MTKSEWLILTIIVVALAIGATFYPYLPLQVVSHWNGAGQPNGMLPRLWAVLTIPLIMFIIAVIFWAIPRIDPKRENIAHFRKYFDYFTVGLMLLLFYSYLLTLLWNIGYQFNFRIAIIIPVAILFYIVGILLPHTQPNWFIGIRTPWTISSPAVWENTHELGGLLFKISAVIGLFGVFFPAPYTLWFLLGPLVVSAVVLVVYSYISWEKGNKR